MSAGMIASAGMGMMAQKQGEIAGINKMRREEQSEKRMADYYYDLSMRKWEDTGVGAQAEQLRKHNMSVGLMYGGSGAGGQSSNVDTSARNVESGTNMGIAGMQMGAQLAMQQAQIENIKAQTEKTKEETKIVPSQGNLMQNQADNVAQDTVAKLNEVNYMVEKGYQNRFNQETADVYNTNVESKLKELQMDQMPKELALKAQEVVIKGQQLAVDWKNADTNAERNQIWRELENMKMDMQKTQFDENMDQRQLEYTVDKVMGVVEGAIGIRSGKIPMTTNTTTYDKDGNYSGERETTTRRGK